MHVSLSDLLTCPRCGPGWGLILLPERVRDRRVETGVLGCPSCRSHFAVAGGVADLRVPDGADEGEDPSPAVAGAGGPPHDEGGDAEAQAVRIGALLGLAGVRGAVLLAGPAATAAPALAALLEGIEVVHVAASPDEPAGATGPDRPGVSRVLARGTLPFRTGGFAGVALTGRAVDLVEEGLRLVGPAGRVLVEPADAAVSERARAAGAARVLAESGTLVVARRP